MGVVEKIDHQTIELAVCVVRYICYLRDVSDTCLRVRGAHQVGLSLTQILCLPKLVGSTTVHSLERSRRQAGLGRGLDYCG